METKKEKVPEEAVGRRFDMCMENGFVKMGMGLLTGGVLSLALFRSNMVRAVATSFATGVGGGIAYVDCRGYFPSKRDNQNFSIPHWNRTNPSPSPSIPEDETLRDPYAPNETSGL